MIWWLPSDLPTKATSRPSGETAARQSAPRGRGRVTPRIFDAAREFAMNQ
jgi:hypothetical protein